VFLLALEKIDDKLFQRQKVVKKKGEEGLFETSKAPAEKKIDPERLKLQQTVDKALMTTISKVDMLKSYLTAKFTLTKYDKPHDMVF
jgi:large subunit ribosomal protein L6e